MSGARHIPAGGTTAHVRARSAGRTVARALADEVAVALTVNGSTHAVMMATPADLADFATGLALTEGLIDTPADIERSEVVTFDTGIEARLWLAEALAARHADRRRAMAGPVGCGLCGIESLEAAVRALPRVAAAQTFPGAAIAAATDALAAHQPLRAETRTTHAAGLMDAAGRIVLVREDVGRHNALDKLIGAAARAGLDMGGHAVVMTSRLSVELVQKCAIAGAPVLIAVSQPTAHAVRLAEGAGLTLVAGARGGRFDIYTHPGRITGA